MKEAQYNDITIEISYLRSIVWDEWIVWGAGILPCCVYQIPLSSRVKQSQHQREGHRTRHGERR